MQNKFFNAHHAPIGAFASFTLGFKGKSGGFGLELGHPANQDIYIGVESDTAGRYNALPFFASSVNTSSAFGIEQSPADDANVNVMAFPDESIERDYEVGTDRWSVGGLRFSIISPVQCVPDPCGADVDKEMLKLAVLPAVIAELEIDNCNSSKEKRAFFGFTGDDSAGMRHLKDQSSGMVGIGQGCRIAICTKTPGVWSGIGFSVEDILSVPCSHDGSFGLGNVALLQIVVPPRQKVAVRYAICFFRDGIVTTGIESSYLYRRFFSSVDNVAAYALANYDSLAASACSVNARFAAHQLSPERSFMLVHAVRSYYGSTQLLDTPSGPMWVVNEGEYRMINTLDLTIDHLFHELLMNPWTIRNVLDWYVQRYSYHDDVHEACLPIRYSGGISFTHDMGVGNVFSAPATSVYEQPGKSGCFSYMTHEQLVNWVLTASVYALYTKDITWIESNRHIWNECLASLVNRDHFSRMSKKGTMQMESCMVGDGYEITTYDSLDPSLGRARNNSYGAVKRWAAFLLLEHVFLKLQLPDEAQSCRSNAVMTAETIVERKTVDGFVQSLFDDSTSATALPLIEGLVYPWFAGCRVQLRLDGQFAELLSVLREHFTRALSTGVCRFDDGGWKLTSSSNITWLSKLYLCRFIATEILQIPENELFSIADKAHLSLLLDDDNSYFAWSDQFCNRSIIGSRYYPRGVTAILWHMEQRYA